ncbi:MAG: SHOCT domain-containing protein [Planctomycetes bacterium]|nr:SHOCT domain-containing protein [Planctomycetota bacterium]
MPRRTRIRLSRWTSALWLLFVGLILAGGVASAARKEEVGSVGWVFLVLAGGIAAFHAANLFAPRGVAYYVMLEEEDRPAAAPDFDGKIRKLAKLREDGLLTEEEHARKRAEILGEKW